VPTNLDLIQFVEESLLEEEKLKESQEECTCCGEWVWYICYLSTLHGTWNEKAWYDFPRILTRLWHLQYWLQQLILSFQMTLIIWWSRRLISS